MSKDILDKPDSLRRVVAILLCRANSTRLYAKPLQWVGNKTILEHLIGQIKIIPRIDEIILAISEGEENAVFASVALSL